MKNLKPYISTIGGETYTIYATCAKEATKTFQKQKKLAKEFCNLVTVQVQENKKSEIIVQAHG